MEKQYVRLAVRLSAVLLAVLLVSKVGKDDTRAIAGEYAGLFSSQLKVGVLPNRLAGNDKEQTDAINQVAERDDSSWKGLTEEVSVIGNEGCDSNGEVYVPEDEASAIGEGKTEDSILSEEFPDDPTSGDSGSDVSAPENEAVTGQEEITEVADSTEEATEGEEDKEMPGEEVFATLSELEAAELRAYYDESYRKTREYVNALLVTHPEHYNESMVNEALSIPTDSNDARYEFITGLGYKAYTTSDMPTGFKSDAQASQQMVTFDVPVWKMNSKGDRYSTVWSITINKNLAASVRCIFSDIYQLEMQFPFNYLKGYMYRKVGGSGLINSKLMSAHSFGVAIDINYWDADNDYYLGKGNDLRNKDNPYCIPDEVIDIFASYGWYWGGDFEICSDTMHFQYFGLEFLQYDSDEPFPILYRGADDMDTIYIRNLAQRLVKLGYLEKETGNFTRKLDTALKKFQEDYGLEPDGIADYETWEPLINATHDMSYVF